MKNKTVRRRLLAAALAAAMVSASLYGCGSENAGDGQEASSESETQEAAADGDDISSDSGKVELTIWAGDSYDDRLFEMVESFKQEYAGQADFEINIEESSDADTRNAVLNAVRISIFGRQRLFPVL